MPEPIVGLLDEADLAIAAVSGLVDDGQFRRLTRAVASLRLRLDYPEDVLIVALAGGTGSGKSSLVNAIAGEEVADVGGMRPTTAKPHGVASPIRVEALSGYLLSIGIEQVSSAGVEDWLCLVDLPDTDTVELHHRLLVDSLLPRIDVVVWVVDPEKYRDASLHMGYIEPLASHADRFVFALNQIDRLAPGQRDEVVADLIDALATDGIDDPRVVATAAGPSAGPPVGIEELIGELAALRGNALLEKTLTELADTCAELLDSIGGSGLGFRERSDEVISAASKLIDTGQVDEATDKVSRFLEGIASEAGPAGQRIRGISAGVPGHIQAAHDELGIPGSRRRLGPFRRGPGETDDERAAVAAASIERRVMTPVREILRQRAGAIAAITTLCLAVGSVRARRSV